jgi:hypothetical protein
MAFAIGRLQPDTFLLGWVHAGMFYQKSWWMQSVSDGGASPASSREPEEALRDPS